MSLWAGAAPRRAGRWRRRGLLIGASVALHLAVLGGWTPRPDTAPASRPRAAPLRLLSVRLQAATAFTAATTVAATAAPTAAPAPPRPRPPGPVTSRPARSPAQARWAPSPMAQPQPETASPAAPTTPALPPLPAAADAAAAVAGVAFGPPRFGGFSGRRWSGTQSASAGVTPSTAQPDLPAQQAHQAQQWQQAQALHSQLQQMWAAMQAQVAQWPTAGPQASEASACPLPREAGTPIACDGLPPLPGLPQLIDAAQAFYRLSPAPVALVLAVAPQGYRIERAP